MSELNFLSNFSRLKPNKEKWEIVSIGVLDGGQVTLCGMKCVNLNYETVKTHGVHFSYKNIISKIKPFANILSK